MTIKNGNLPAQPQPLAAGPDGEVLTALTHLVGEDNYTGLTKREHFAGLAMQAWIQHHGAANNYGFSNEDAATSAVAAADALLAELEK